MKCLNGCGSMENTLYKGAEIDVCPSCLGVWLDETQLADIVAAADDRWPPGVIEWALARTERRMTVSANEHERPLECPSCARSLHGVNYQGDSGVIIKTCLRRHGVWLNRGELATLQIVVRHRHLKLESA